MITKIRTWLAANFLVLLGAFAQTRVPLIETAMESLAWLIRLAGDGLSGLFA